MLRAVLFDAQCQVFCFGYFFGAQSGHWPGRLFGFVRQSEGLHIRGGIGFLTRWPYLAAQGT